MSALTDTPLDSSDAACPKSGDLAEDILFAYSSHIQAHENLLIFLNQQIQHSSLRVLRCGRPLRVAACRDESIVRLTIERNIAALPWSREATKHAVIRLA